MKDLMYYTNLKVIKLNIAIAQKHLTKYNDLVYLEF